MGQRFELHPSRLRRAVTVAFGALVLVLGCRSASPPTIVPTSRPPVDEAELQAIVEPLETSPLVSRVEEREADIMLRVGLSTDQSEIRFPCCLDLRVQGQGNGFSVTKSFAVRPAPEAVSAPVFRLQVAALQDEAQADELAVRLGRVTGQPADVVLDAETGLHRVRVGRYDRREAAETARRVLASAGTTGTWIATENGVMRRPGFELVAAGTARRVAGRWLAVARVGEDGIPVAGRRYRGQVLLYLNDRGSLNVINEVDLESYLRGVVPVEMGPVAYPELAALKAQAVAARTYAVRNLAEFEVEGYDICATPRCQVYEGMGVEHPRSDRAVSQTAGEVLVWRGDPIEALYSASCGGHTEDVGLVFPSKRDLSYLAGVPCLERGAQLISGVYPRGSPFPEIVMRSMVPIDRSGAAAFAGRVERLAGAAGVPAATVDPPASLAWPDIERYLLHRLDLVLDARLLSGEGQLERLVAAPPPTWSAADLRLAKLFMEVDGRSPGPLSPSDLDRLLYGLATVIGLVREQEVQFLSFGDRELVVKDQAGVFRIPAPSPTPSFRREQGRLVAGDLPLVPGDPLRVVRRDEELLAVVQAFEPQERGRDAEAGPPVWSRFRSDRRLAQLAGEHYPGLQLERLEIGERGVSGRVGWIQLVGQNGRLERVEGLAVRWTLDLPDTWFEARRTRSTDGAPGWMFTGRGRGHGVGMCQIGSYGMAVRGHGYRSILSYYYTGTELARVEGRFQRVYQVGR